MAIHTQRFYFLDNCSEHLKVRKKCKNDLQERGENHVRLKSCFSPFSNNNLTIHLRQLIFLDIIQCVVVPFTVYLTKKTLPGRVQNICRSSHVFSVNVHVHIPPINLREGSGIILRTDLIFPAEWRHSNGNSRWGNREVVSKSTIKPGLWKKRRKNKDKAQEIRAHRTSYSTESDSVKGIIVLMMVSQSKLW